MKWRLSRAFFFTTLFENCVTNYSNYYYYYLQRKKRVKAISLLYVEKKMCNLIARKCPGHGLSGKKKQNPIIACLNCGVLFYFFWNIFFSWLLLLSLLDFLPHMKCARTWFLSFVLFPLFCHGCTTRYINIYYILFFFVCFPSVLLSRHSKEPFSVVATRRRRERMILLPNMC